MENIGNIKIDTEKLYIQSNQSIFCESFYFIDIYDENAYKKFIKQTERLIRKSKEYTKYIETLRTNVPALNYDSIMSNISNADASLELHHYPLNLYTIVEIVLNHHLMKKDKVTSFSIAKEVMECHFRNIIGLVSLATTNHQLAHLSSIFLDKRQVFGDYERFLEEYKDAITVDVKEKIERLNQLSENNSAIDFKGIL
jgi:hypothetical protein